MEKPTTIRNQMLATLSVTLSMVCGGFLMGLPSPLLVKLQAENSTLPVTSEQGSTITSTLYVGNIFGALLVILILNRLGRKLPLVLTSIPYGLSFILISAAQNYWWLIASRFITGLTAGVHYTILPIYLTEIADDKVRGILGVINNLMMNLGILIVYCVGPWVDHIALGGIGLVIPILFGLTFVWMPETPYYLVMKGKSREAEKNLSWLRGTNDVTEELREVEENIENDRRNSGSIRELVMSKGNRKALMIISVLILAPQLSGIGAILAYTGLIFEASGSEMDSSISIIIIGVIQFVSGVLGMFCVDLLGRRPLMMFSICGSTIFLMGEALYFQLQGNGTDVSGISWLPVVAIVGYIICYAVGLGPLPYLVLSELFPCSVKAIAGTYTTILGSLGGVAVTKLYQVIADAYGIHVSFWVFVGCSGVFAILIYFMLPETMKRSLTDIHNELRGLTESKVVLTE